MNVEKKIEMGNILTSKASIESRNNLVFFNNNLDFDLFLNKFINYLHAIFLFWHV